VEGAEASAESEPVAPANPVAAILAAITGADEDEPMAEEPPAPPVDPAPVVEAPAVVDLPAPPVEPAPVVEAPAVVEPPAPPAEPAPVVEEPPVNTAPAADTELAAVPAAPAPAENDPDTLDFVEVSVLDGGRLRGIRQAKPVIVRIADIEALPFSERCGTGGPGGVGWPCGAHARAELARLVGRQPVECRVIAEAAGSTKVREVVASCKVGDDDLSLWVARNGWGKPTAGGGFALHEADRLAEKEARGRFAPTSPVTN
jgi:endonuclease YncB( thermonuclease family)